MHFFIIFNTTTPIMLQYCHIISILSLSLNSAAVNFTMHIHLTILITALDNANFVILGQVSLSVLRNIQPVTHNCTQSFKLRRDPLPLKMKAECDLTNLLRK